VEGPEALANNRVGFSQQNKNSQATFGFFFKKIKEYIIKQRDSVIGVITIIS
jgi:hypothetical protein